MTAPSPTPIDTALRVSSAHLAQLCDALMQAGALAAGRQVVLVTIAFEVPGGLPDTHAPLQARTRIDRLTRSLVFLQGDLVTGEAVALTANAVLRIAD